MRREPLMLINRETTEASGGRGSGGGGCEGGGGSGGDRAPACSKGRTSNNQLNTTSFFADTSTYQDNCCHYVEEDPWKKEISPAEIRSDLVNLKLVQFLLDNGADPTIQVSIVM